MGKESYKKDILELRKKGKSYNYIVEKIGCSKATVSYHCKRNGMAPEKSSSRKVTDEYIKQANIIYKNNTLKETFKILKSEFPNIDVTKKTLKIYLKPKLKRSLTVKERKKRRIESVKKRRKKLRLMSIDYLGGKCSKCGYNDCIDALETHHVDPNEKDFSLSMRGLTRSWKKIKKELDKCILVCANCHREIHYELNKNL